jgi:SagB-type dehydrogenase family enzyme
MHIRPIKSVYRYHQDTGYERGKMAWHSLDWQNQPSVYKVYKGINPIPLPDGIPSMHNNIFDLLKDAEKGDRSQSIDLEQLALILRLTHTLTTRASNAGDDFYYRSAASAGALYPTEIYVVTHKVRSLDDGLYHFGIKGHVLTPLRTGNLSGYISGRIRPPSSAAPAVFFIFTVIYFRSSWKYRERAYRYHLLDTGHVLENLHLAVNALGLLLRLFYDFNDKNINTLVGLDDHKEVSLALACIAGSESAIDSCMTMITALPDNISSASIVSGRELDYPSITDIHKTGEKIVTGYDSEHDMFSCPVSPEIWESIPDPIPLPDTVRYPECLLRRRSKRNFANKPLDKNTLLLLLDGLCSCDVYVPETSSRYNRSFFVGFIVENIDDVAPGIFLLDRTNRRFGLIGKGHLVDRMAHACLDQLWLRNANIHFLFFSDLDLLEQFRGTRGYRYANMGAGRLGERIYIMASALGLGCCGIGAFYDLEAADITGLNKSSQLLYLVATGRIPKTIKA